MLEYYFPILIITQCVAVIKNRLKEVQKVRAKKQVPDTLNQKNKAKPIVSTVHDLPFD